MPYLLTGAIDPIAVVELEQAMGEVAFPADASGRLRAEPVGDVYAFDDALQTAPQLGRHAPRDL